MSGLNFEIVHAAVSYWLGALSEPVLMIDRDEMGRAVARGAIVWDVREPAEFKRDHADHAVSLGTVEWLLAENSGGNLIPANVIADALSEAGIKAGREVIIYAEQRAVDAFVALRALRSIGIDDAQVCLGDAHCAWRPAAASASSRVGAAGLPGTPDPVRLPISSAAPSPRRYPAAG